MLLAALVAGLANFAVLRSADDRVTVVVAGRDLVAGSTLTTEDLGTMRVGLADATDAGLVASADLPGLLGEVVTVAVPAGSALRPGDLRPAAAERGLRRMSLPIDPERAVGGAVAVGDRVDVLATMSDRSVWLLGDVAVLAAGARDGAVLAGATGDWSLTLAVDADAARCLATALAATQLTVVLATGTEPVTADGCAALDEATTDEGSS